MFEKASRLALRFHSTRGVLSVEDLWTLSLTELDNIAKALHKTVRGAEEEQSFIPGTKSAKATAEAERQALSFEIVKHIIGIRVQERDERAQAAEKAERKRELLGLLAEKDAADLKSKSREEIEKMLNEL
jgi:hypothetical protein